MDSSQISPNPKLTVRLIAPDEQSRFDETLERAHWLGAGLVGEVMRYVAEENGEWVALIGFGSAALCVRARDASIGWSERQRWNRLRYIANNQRFCVLDEHRRPNLASQALGAVLRRLSFDYEQRWGHPVVLVETFTDPARHLGTCYKAANFTQLGRTSGYGRKAGHFAHHGVEKVIWTKMLRRDALRLLASNFDHPLLDKRRGTLMTAIDLNSVDLDSENGLLERLSTVTDPRMRRGVRHSIVSILAIAAIGTLRGARSFRALGETAAELPQEALARLDARISPTTGLRVAPDSSTIRRNLNAVDRNEFDQVVGSWLSDQVAANRAKRRQTDSEEPSAGDDDDKTKDLTALAIDGKALRGARLDGGGQVHLLSALTHDEGIVIAQRNVDGKTNEITEFCPLLEEIDITDVVITADALHAQRSHAQYLQERDAHFIFGLKGNQPKLASAAMKLLEGRPAVAETHDRAHGRIEHRYLSVAAVPEELAKKLNFPSAATFVAIYRERCDLAGSIGSSETSYYVTDLTEAEAGPKQLARHIRNHWGIENRSHWVRDNTYDEDRCSVRRGAAPQVLATLRNLAISILRLAGFASIASGTRWAAWDPERTLALMGL